MTETVWVVSVGDAYASAFHGVFSSEEKAQAYIDALPPSRKCEAYYEKYELDGTDNGRE